MTIKNHILATLQQFEVDNNVVIEYAAVSGSKDFGYDRLNSDFDIGFVYTGTYATSPISDIYLEKSVNYHGRQINNFYVSLDSSDYWEWNLITANVNIERTINFINDSVLNHPYNKKDLIASYYFNTLSMFMSHISENNIGHVSTYLSIINNLLRIRWLDKFNNLDFPVFRTHFNYSNTLKIPLKVIQIIKFLLQSTEINEERQDKLDKFILDHLQNIKMRLEL